MSSASPDPIPDPDCPRCAWIRPFTSLYVRYHDEEWGVPVHDDRQMLEHLLLETAQAGLSWYTVLAKRENYRAAFAGFDPQAIAAFDDTDVEGLLQNAGLVRNRLKINAAINNARCFLELQAREGSFSDFLWQFVDGTPQVNRPRTMADIRATSPESESMSKELKRRGFRFVGPTICYAHMQATGLVNDHLDNCFRTQEIRASY